MRVGANAELAIIRNDFVIGLHEFVMSAPTERRSTRAYADATPVKSAHFSWKECTAGLLHLCCR